MVDKADVTWRLNWSIWWREHWPAGVLIAALGIVLFPAAALWPMYEDRAFICENTGSHHGYRQWCNGLQFGRWYRESRLEQFVRQQHPSEMQNRWTRYIGDGRNIFGTVISHSHGRPLWGACMTNPAVFDRYVETLDDAARLDLFRRLSLGRPSETEAEEKKIEEIALARGWPIE